MSRQRKLPAGLQRVAASELRVEEQAWRRIEDDRYADLVANLAARPAMLDARPIITDRYGVAIAGRHRLQAAVELLERPGRSTFKRHHREGLPVYARDFTPAERREWALSDNADFAQDVPDEVAKLVAEHQAEGADLQLLGLAAPEIDHLLELELGSAPAERGPPSEDLPPKPAKPKTRLGDLYELGPHRLLCGDSTDLATIERLMEGELAHLVFTDPPYGVGYEGGTKKREKVAGDQHGTGIYSEALPVIASCSEEKAPLYLWHADRAALPVGRALESAGYEVRAQLIWSKNQAQFGALSAQYKQKHEPCLYAHRRGRAPWWYGPKNEVTVWEADRAPSNDYHPTQKPVELAERALANSSQEGDLVLDPFAGSGSTLIACETQGRLGRAAELDPGYCDVIVARWEEYTGQKAERHRRRR